MATISGDTEGILLTDHKEKSLNVTGEYYASLIKRLKDSIRDKNTEKLTKDVLLVHDNTPVHKAGYPAQGRLRYHWPPSLPSGLALLRLTSFLLKKNCLRRNCPAMKVKEAVSAYFDGKQKSFSLRMYTS